MMGDSETNEMLLKVKLDQNELNKTLAGNQRLEREIKDTADVMGQLGTSAAAGVNRLNSEFDSAQVEIEQLRRETLDYIGDLERLDNMTVSPNISPTGGAGGNRLDQLDRLGSVGTQIFGAFGASELGNVSGLVGDFAQGIGTLNPLLLSGTVAIGGLALAVNTAKENTKAAAEVFENLLAGEIGGRRSARELTTEQAQERQQEVLDLVTFEEGVYEDLRQQRDDFLAGLNQFDRGRALEGLAFPEFQALQNQLANQLTVVNDLNSEYNGLQIALEDGTTAANDLRAAEEARQEALTEANSLRIAAINEQLQKEQELSAFTRTATVQQLDNRLAALEEERRAIESSNAALLAIEEPTEEVIAQAVTYEARLQAIAKETEHLNEVSRPMIELREREAALNDALTDSYSEALEATENTVKAQQQLTETTNALREAEAQAEADRAKIATELEAKKGEINDAANASILENTDKAAKERAKLLQEGEERIAEITRRSIATQANAIGRRDALAYYLAQQAEKQQIEDEKKAQQKRLDDLDDALKEQNDLVRKRADDQTKQAVKAADERLRTTNEANRKEIDLKRQANDKAINDLRNAKAAEAAIYQNVQRIAEQTGATTRAQFVNIQQTVQAGLSFIQQGFQNLFTDIARMRNGAVYQYQQPIGPTLSGQTGGSRSDNWFNTPFAFTSSQSNIPAPQRQNVLNVSINGAQTQTIDVHSRQQAVKALNEYMVGMGMK